MNSAGESQRGGHWWSPPLVRLADSCVDASLGNPVQMWWWSSLSRGKFGDVLGKALHSNL